ncbi:MAG: UbiX family flavin prenyltransferase [Acidobacteriia bacterium]|nr:UbiX family flavin prenyltransferase [Terriglobia bacterium]
MILANVGSIPEKRTGIVPRGAELGVFCSEYGTDRIRREGPGGNRRPPVRVIVGITGASGSIYGLRLLERLAGRPEAEVHLILSRAGEKTLFLETGKSAADARKMAHFWYPPEDIGCRLASGSYPVEAMVIAPCSIHTMSAIAQGISSNLMVRAADVALKEKRRLILLVRESPFHLGHLRNMTALAEMGAIIAPPIPGFYARPQSVMDLVDHSLDRALDLLGLPDPAARRWEGSAP